MGVKIDGIPDEYGNADVTMKGGVSTRTNMRDLIKITKAEYDECDEACPMYVLHSEWNQFLLRFSAIPESALALGRSLEGFPFSLLTTAT